MGRSINWESQIERDYIYLLEYDPDVIAYKEQSFTIHYKVGKRRLRYTPDFLVERRSKRQVVEVKPQSKITNSKNKLKFQVGRKFCRKEGCEFIVVTDGQIRKGHMLGNIKLLHRYARASPPPSFYQEIKRAFSEEEELTLETLTETLVDKFGKDAIGYIYSLLFHRRLQVDLDQKIGGSTIISISDYGVI